MTAVSVAPHTIWSMGPSKVFQTDGMTSQLGSQTIDSVDSTSNDPLVLVPHINNVVIFDDDDDDDGDDGSFLTFDVAVVDAKHRDDPADEWSQGRLLVVVKAHRADRWNLPHDDDDTIDGETKRNRNIMME